MMNYSGPGISEKLISFFIQSFNTIYNGRVFCQTLNKNIESIKWENFHLKCFNLYQDSRRHVIVNWFPHPVWHLILINKAPLFNASCIAEESSPTKKVLIVVFWRFVDTDHFCLNCDVGFCWFLFNSFLHLSLAYPLSEIFLNIFKEALPVLITGILRQNKTLIHLNDAVTQRQRVVHVTQISIINWTHQPYTWSSIVFAEIPWEYVNSSYLNVRVWVYMFVPDLDQKWHPRSSSFVLAAVSGRDSGFSCVYRVSSLLPDWIIIV